MRRRVTLLVAATTSVVLLAFLIPVAVLTGDVARESALQQALAQTQSLAAVAGTGDLDALDAAVAQVESNGLVVTVFLDGDVVTGSTRESDFAVQGTARTAQASVRSTPEGGRVILQPVLGEDGTQVVRVEVPPDRLDVGVTRARGILVLLALVLFIGCLLVADRIARSFTRPLDAVSVAAERLARGELDTRVVPEGTHETQEIAHAMNRLAARIGELLEAERELVADLSHRLRTPTTALRLDAEAVRDADDRDRLLGDIDDLTRQIDDLILEARRSEREGVLARCDAVAVTAERLRYWRPLLEDQDRTVEVSLPADAREVRVAAADLAAALDALVGNVVAHTGEGVALAVSITPGDDGATVVQVEDAGDGLDPDRAGERGHSGAGSTGLGLDIARRTAVASGGDIRIGRSARLGGACIELELAPPTA